MKIFFLTINVKYCIRDSKHKILNINIYNMVRKVNKNRNLPVDVEPLQRPRPLNDMAYESLKNAILMGRLETGEIYSELELAGKLGTSRTPVREALLRLAAENFIVFHPKKGMAINYFSKEDIENLFELREAIEERAVTKITGNLNKDQIQKIKHILAEQEECAKNNYDEKLFLEIDKKFHLFLIEASGNRFMVQSYKNIRDYITLPAKKALMRKGRVNEVIQEHKAIVKALLEEDVEMVKEVTKKHLINSKLTALEGHY